MTALRIGTRASALALAQAEWVAARIDAPATLVPLSSSGDAGAAPGDKARWVDTIEAALLDGGVDLAVHSAKDVPGYPAAGTVIAAVPPRRDPADVLLGSLAPGARVGTASLRRRAQLLAWRPDLAVTELRGNVDTRLSRLSEGAVDAVVLARAGLERLGRPELAGARALTELAADPVTAPTKLAARSGTAPAGLAPGPGAVPTGPAEVFVPAAGQGALIVQARADDAAARAAAATLNDPASHACLSAERAAVVRLGASCQTPVGIHADGASIRGFVGAPDGSEWVIDRQDGSDGVALAERLLAGGARAILDRLEAAA